MSEFIAPEALPLGMQLVWRGVSEKGWDRIAQIKIETGTDGDEAHVGIVAVRHTLAGSVRPLLNAAPETVAILRSMGMENGEIADAAAKKRDVETIKTHQQTAMRVLGQPGRAHMGTQRLFDCGLLAVKQHLRPLNPPADEDREYLRLLCENPTAKEVGKRWDEDEGVKLDPEQVRNRVRGLKVKGGLPRMRMAGLVLWWNVLHPDLRAEPEA